VKVKFVYGICPAFIKYVDYPLTALNTDDAWGKHNGPFIKIQEKYKGIEWLLEHELRHVKQWYRHGMIIHTLLYKYNLKYRAWSERDAKGVN
jgi:hypothetical protein